MDLIPVQWGLEEFVSTPHATTRLLEVGLSHISTILPIIHEPTLRFDQIPRELSASFLCIGLLICGDSTAHEIGCTLLHRLREETLRFAQTVIMKIDHHLCILQAMLVIEVAGMFYANRIAVELSDIFHGTLVTLARRLGLFEPDHQPSRLIVRQSTDEKWQEWIQKECLKRLAYFIFVVDVQHGMLFSHDRCITSVFTLKLELPCNRQTWQATDARQWLSLEKSAVPRSLRFHELQQLLLSSYESYQNLPELDSLGSYLVLSGMASVSIDSLQRRNDPFFDHERVIECLHTRLPVIYKELIIQPENNMKNHGLMTYYMSLISLCTPPDDLERASNSGFSLIGTASTEQARAAMVRLLTRNKVGPDSARHAINLLRIYIPASLDTFSPFEASALYLGALTLWAHVLGLGYDPQVFDIISEQSELETMAALEGILEARDAVECGKHWRRIVRYISERLGAMKNDNAREYSEVLRALGEATR